MGKSTTLKEMREAALAEKRAQQKRTVMEALKDGGKPYKDLLRATNIGTESLHKILTALAEDEAITIELKQFEKGPLVRVFILKPEPLLEA